MNFEQEDKLIKYIDWIRSMPFHRWWSMRSLKWNQFAKAKGLNENVIPDWFMADREKYCDLIYDKFLKQSLETQEREIEALVKQHNELLLSVEIVLAEEHLRQLKSKGK